MIMSRRRLLHHPIQWGRWQYSRGIAALSTTKQIKFDVLLTNSTSADMQPYSCGKRLPSNSSSYQYNDSIRSICLYNSSGGDIISKMKIHLQQSQFSLLFMLPPRCHTQLQSQKLVQSRWFSVNRRGRGGVPRMSEMRSLEEALTATYDNLDRLSPRDVSAFWEEG